MKYVILIVFLLALSTALWAQGDQPDPFCYQARDNVCNGMDNCVRVTFTPTQNTNVKFKCEIGCGQSVPHDHCRVSATIGPATGGEVLATCSNWSEQGCWDNSNDAPQDVRLIGCTTYVIIACLESCGHQDCCPNCRAVATVWEQGATCPAP